MSRHHAVDAPSSDQPVNVPRETADPIVVALRLALREIAERRAADRADRRATMVIVDGGKRDGGRAA